MKYFNYLGKDETNRIFYKEPKEFDRHDDRELLQYALGPVMYCPATNKDLGKNIVSSKFKGLMSLAICLEDAVGDKQVELAEEMLVGHLKYINDRVDDLNTVPFIFVRIRSAEHLNKVYKKIKPYMELVTGFMLPKITTSDVLEYMNSMEVINSEHRFNIYALPILESSYIIHNETRDIELRKIKTLLDSYRRLVLNVRIGATDFSSLFALRRTSSRPIYDIGVVANCIYDIINHFGRQGGYVISGPVWEYFKSGERLLKPQLRQTPFVDRLGESGVELRGELIHDVKDGIIMETLLDLENGLIGKTIIHPSHINIVQSLHVVTHEMYSDALRIVSENNGDAGVCSSEYNNKMNEIKPHLAWANKILKRADIYGVYNRNKSYIDLLEVE